MIAALAPALTPLFLFALLPALFAVMRQRRETDADLPARWALAWRSALAFTLAFNLMFFVQEIFLVWPKALTPGLEPTLFHNNHTWLGTHPAVDLLQGTGALGTLLAGALAWLWLAFLTPRRLELRLLVFWLAVLGFLLALPQFVIGATIPANDVGRAMTGLGFTPAARVAAAAAAMLAMATVCWRLAPYLLSMAAGPRSRIGGWLGFLPALLAIPLIVPFRVPNHPIEVLLPPVTDALIAGAWLWAMASVVRPTEAVAVRGSAVPLWIAALVLLAFFQFVLSPGVRF